jgi:hypothetical protein
VNRLNRSRLAPLQVRTHASLPTQPQASSPDPPGACQSLIVHRRPHHHRVCTQQPTSPESHQSRLLMVVVHSTMIW